MNKGNEIGSCTLNLSAPISQAPEGKPKSLHVFISTILPTVTEMILPLLYNGSDIGITLTTKLAVTRRETANEIAQSVGLHTTQQATLLTEAESPLLNHSLVEEISKRAGSWDVLLGRLEVVVNLGDQLAEVSTKLDRVILHV